MNVTSEQVFASFEKLCQYDALMSTARGKPLDYG
jgi:hypothetical protein